MSCENLSIQQQKVGVLGCIQRKLVGDEEQVAVLIQGRRPQKEPMTQPVDMARRRYLRTSGRHLAELLGEIRMAASPVEDTPQLPPGGCGTPAKRF